MPPVEWRELWRTDTRGGWWVRIASPILAALTVLVWHAVAGTMRPVFPTVLALSVLAVVSFPVVARVTGRAGTFVTPGRWILEKTTGKVVEAEESPPYSTWVPDRLSGLAASLFLVSLFFPLMGVPVRYSAMVCVIAFSGYVAWRVWWGTSERAAYVRESQDRELNGGWEYVEYAPIPTGPVDKRQEVIDVWYAIVAPPRPTRAEVTEARRAGIDPPPVTPLSDTKIIDEHLVLRPDGGFATPLSLPKRTNLGADHVQSHATLIAKAYGVPATGVVVSPYRGGEFGAGYVDLLVCATDPLSRVTTWTGPTMREEPNGDVTAIVGDTVTGEVRQRLWRGQGDGAVHGLYVGAPRSGKSSWWGPLTLDEICTGVVWVVLADAAKGGQSLAALADSGLVHDVARTLAESRKAIAAVFATYDFRRHEERGTGHLPTRERPYIRLLVPEAGRVLADRECRAMLSELLSVGPAFGVGISLDTQTSTKKALGDDEYVQGTAMSGNLVATYLPARGVASTLPALGHVDLSAIGDGRPGVGFASGVGIASTVLARGRLVTDESVSAARDAAGPLLTLDDWTSTGGAEYRTVRTIGHLPNERDDS